MNTTHSESKKTRKIVTFEPYRDVGNMLKQAKEHGLTVSEVLNKALREHGPSIIGEIARKHVNRLKRLLVA